MGDAKPLEILLVEDSPADAELTIRTLRKNNLANRLFHAKDGAEALDFIFGRGAYPDRTPGHGPNLVLLDLKLPKLDGLEVLKRIRSDDRTKTIPVIVLTSSREDKDIYESYSLGVNSYIVKPVEFEAFAGVVSQLGLYWMILNEPPGGNG